MYSVMFSYKKECNATFLKYYKFIHVSHFILLKPAGFLSYLILTEHLVMLQCMLNTMSKTSKQYN